MKNNHKGITLIILVITIIILLVLAGIVILQLTGENGLISRVNQTKKAQVEGEMKEKLNLVISELQIEKEGNVTIIDITQEYLSEKINDYEIVVIEDASIKGEKVKMKKGEIIGIFMIDENLNVTEVQNDGNIQFLYETGPRVGENVYILIHIQDRENGLQKIELPEKDAIILNGKKKEVGIDYVVELGKEYKIKITSTNGNVKEEVILIEKYYYTVTMDLGMGVEIDNNAVKIAYNDIYEATLILGEIFGEKCYELETLIVTMDDQEIEVDKTGNKIKIDKVIGNIKIVAKAKFPLVDYWPLKDSLKNEINEKNNFVTMDETNPSFEDNSIYLNGTVLNTQENYLLPRKFTMIFNYKPTEEVEPWTLIFGKITYYANNNTYNGMFVYKNGLYLYNGTDEEYLVGLPSELIKVGEYSNFIITYDGIDCKLYINKKLVLQVEGYNDLNSPLYVGGSKYSGSNVVGRDWMYAKGYYRDIRIYNYAFSEEKVNQYDNTK